MNELKRPRFPGMPELVGFDCLARSPSLAKAAQELAISPSAVSKRLREIESFLGCRLFERSTRHLQLTPAGMQFAAATREALSLIEAATLSLRTREQNQWHLDLTVSPTLCSRWLIPRLASFYAAYPQATIDIQMNTGVPDFSSQRLDCALVYCDSAPLGLQSVRVLDLVLVPVVAAMIVKESAQSDWRSIIQSLPLLRQNSLPSAWQRFLEKANISSDKVHASTIYTRLALEHQAALTGLGISLLPLYLISEDLRAKRLLRLGDLQCEGLGGYFLVSRELGRTPVLKAFQTWLHETAAQPN
jgi:LysR family transcriptional regulator, glycine cleavage system transcriptional activator